MRPCPPPQRVPYPPEKGLLYSRATICPPRVRGPGWDPPLRPRGSAPDCGPSQTTAVLAPGPSVSWEGLPVPSDRAAMSCPLTLLRRLKKDSPSRSLEPAALQLRNGRTGISHGIKGNEDSAEAQPKLPSFPVGCLGAHAAGQAQQAHRPMPSTGPALVPSDAHCPGCREHVWTFWLPGFWTNGRVHRLPGGEGQRTLDAGGVQCGWV